MIVKEPLVQEKLKQDYHWNHHLNGKSNAERRDSSTTVTLLRENDKTKILRITIWLNKNLSLSEGTITQVVV